jgi:hypothetical protein
MKRFAIATLLLLSSSACGSSRPSPLADLGEITSAQVTVFSNTASTTKTLTDPATLTALRALATARGAWKPTWHTPPAGQVRAALYRDTTYLGVISIGPDFIGARGASAEQFRPIAPSEATAAATFRALK